MGREPAQIEGSYVRWSQCSTTEVICARFWVSEFEKCSTFDDAPLWKRMENRHKCRPPILRLWVTSNSQWLLKTKTPQRVSDIVSHIRWKSTIMAELCDTRLIFFLQLSDVTLYVNRQRSLVVANLIAILSSSLLQLVRCVGLVLYILLHFTTFYYIFSLVFLAQFHRSTPPLCKVPACGVLCVFV